MFTSMIMVGLILNISGRRKKAIFVECKFTSKPMPYNEYEDLVIATRAFKNIENKQLWFFSKSGYSDSVISQAKKDDTVLLTVDDLFLV